MKILPLFLVTFVILCGCSSAQLTGPSSRNLQLSKVEKLEIGKAGESEITKLIGKPDKIITLKNKFAGYFAWVYSEKVNGQDTDRLGLLIDTKTGILKSATWTIFEGEGLSIKDNALLYFRNSKFTSKQIGQVAQDYYTEDVVYQDEQSGVSIYLDSTKKTVQSITFEPVATRVPAIN